MTDTVTLLTALQNELATAELVRRPNTAVPDLPPAFVEPGQAVDPGERDAPERDDVLVVNLELDSTAAVAPGRDRVVVAVRFHSKGTGGLKAGRILYAAIKARLVDRTDYGLGWVMDEGGEQPTTILSSGMFASLSPVGITEDGIRREVARFAFEVLA